MPEGGYYGAALYGQGGEGIDQSVAGSGLQKEIAAGHYLIENEYLAANVIEVDRAYDYPTTSG